jgi:hypothetical protein
MSDLGGKEAVAWFERRSGVVFGGVVRRDCRSGSQGTLQLRNVRCLP